MTAKKKTKKKVSKKKVVKSSKQKLSVGCVNGGFMYTPVIVADIEGSAVKFYCEQRFTEKTEADRIVDCVSDLTE